MESLFSGAYKGRRVLVTGHTGFKGSWLCLWLQALGARVSGLALAPATEPSHWDLLALDGIDDLRVDIRDADSLRGAVARLQPELVIHLAAQPLVRRGYHLPTETFATNVTGLVNLFEAVRACPATRAVVNATTDKVYREGAGTVAGYVEDDPLGGHDPYSTSKACAELVSDCYRSSYFGPEGGPALATARAGNVIGGGDWSEDRLVPDLVRAATSGKPLRLRNPEAVRPWQHVLEPLAGYLRLGQLLLAGEAVQGAWNFGPSHDATLPVQSLAQRMLAHWPEVQLEAADGPQPREANALRLRCGKADRELGWRPVWDAQTTIDRTMQWYRSHHQQLGLRSAGDLDGFVASAREARVAWAT